MFSVAFIGKRTFLLFYLCLEIREGKFKSKPRVGKLSGSLHIALLGIFWLLSLSGNVWAQDCTPNKIKGDIQKFAHKNESEQNAAIERVKVCEEKAIPYLTEALKSPNPEIRFKAMWSLGDMGEKAKGAAPELRRLLRDSNQSLTIRKRAANALERIGSKEKETVSALVEALKYDESIRSSAIIALGAIVSRETYPKLVTQLDNEQVGLSAAEALGRSGWGVDKAINKLLGVLEVGDEQERLQAIQAIKSIAEALEYRNNEGYLPKENLKKTITALEEANTELQKYESRLTSFSRQQSQETRKQLDKSIRSIKKAQASPVLDVFSKNPPLWVIPFYFILFSFYGIILLVRPLGLLYFNDFLKSYGEIPLPFLPTSLPIRIIFLGGLFHYHPRVLNAWVEKHYSLAEDNFRKNKMVKACGNYNPVPVILNDEPIGFPSPENLKQQFDKLPTRLLIWDEKDFFKTTSLACEISKWAMEGKLTKHQHRVLPILIEHNLQRYKEDESNKVFLNEIRRELRDLVKVETISEDLVKQLLKQQRLLVIVNDFSERDTETQTAIRLALHDIDNFPVCTLIVTSRSEETLQESDMVVIRFSPS
jgi:hypothetical protein